MMLLTVAIALLMQISSPSAQSVLTCQCGVFASRETVAQGPVYIFAPETPAPECTGSASVNCQTECIGTWSNFLASNGWEDFTPQDPAVTYGDQICNGSRAAFGILPFETTCFPGTADMRFRLSNCTGRIGQWEQAVETTQDFCCDQLGDYVPGCPRSAAKIRAGFFEIPKSGDNKRGKLH